MLRNLQCRLPGDCQVSVTEAPCALETGYQTGLVLSLVPLPHLWLEGHSQG